MAQADSKGPVKNAYFYYVEEVADLHGYNVDTNFEAMARKFGGDWVKMSKEEKLPYEQKVKDAKEKEKLCINDKYTVTGESYGMLHRKNLEEKILEEEMEQFLKDITAGPDALDRTFICIKTGHTIEEVISWQSRLQWPNEISLVAFSLKTGIKAYYTQLVDTVSLPTGYASEALENCAETLLPMPGDREVFDSKCRNYLEILKNINGFINHYLKGGYENIPSHKRVVFCLESEIIHTTGCLQWLVNQLRGEEKTKYQDILDHMKVYRLPKLVLALAEEAQRVNPDYRTSFTSFRLETSAEEMITRAHFDYREEIGCEFHKSDAAILKIHTCTQSIAMRRIYLLFEELTKAYKLPMTFRHNIKGLQKWSRGVIQEQIPAPPVKEEDFGWAVAGKKCKGKGVATQPSCTWNSWSPPTNFTPAPPVTSNAWKVPQPTKAVASYAEEPKEVVASAQEPTKFILASAEVPTSVAPWLSGSVAPAFAIEEDEFPSLLSGTDVGRSRGRGRGRGGGGCWNKRV